MTSSTVRKITRSTLVISRLRQAVFARACVLFALDCACGRWKTGLAIF